MRQLFLLLLLHTLLYGVELQPKERENLLEDLRLFKYASLAKQPVPPYDASLHLDYVPKDIDLNEKLSAPQRRVAESFFYTQVFMVSTVMALWFMPESVSKWDKNALEEKSLSQRWKEHVQAGPVWDHDDFFINYVGHPVSGAWYYTAARGCGISPEGSFLYSFFLSTFIWEYGYEAFAEIPSWQDIFSTPVVGSLMGEGLYYLEKRIDKNHGEVLGSKLLGGVSYFLLNPIGNITNGMSEFFDIHAIFRWKTYQPSYSLAHIRKTLLVDKPHNLLQQDFGFVVEIQY